MIQFLSPPVRAPSVMRCAFGAACAGDDRLGGGGSGEMGLVARSARARAAERASWKTRA
jgi:hypothetical protein